MLNVLSGAAKLLGLVVRCDRQFRDLRLLKLLYCTLVKSPLNYASVTWNPICQNYLIRLEIVQRRFFMYLWFKFHGASFKLHIENGVLHSE